MSPLKRGQKTGSGSLVDITYFIWKTLELIIEVIAGYLENPPTIKHGFF